MELTQSRAINLHTAIDKDIQNRLDVMGFDAEENPAVRAQMIYNALSQAIGSRVDLTNLDMATGGWSMKTLGLTLGQYAGIPFILPSISFGRTSYTHNVSVREDKFDTKISSIRK